MATCPHPYNLQSYVDGALTDRQQERVEQHLQECSDCAECVSELERLRDLIDTRPIDPPAGLLEEILQFARAAPPVPDLSCSEAQRMASAYIDDELSENERQTLEVHLFACDDCFYEYMALRRAARAMRQAPRLSPAGDLKQRILQAVDDASEKETATEDAGVVTLITDNWKRVLAPVAAAAAVALLAFGISYVSLTPQHSSETTVAKKNAPVHQPAERQLASSETAPESESDNNEKPASENASDATDDGVIDSDAKAIADSSAVDTADAAAGSASTDEPANAAETTPSDTGRRLARHHDNHPSERDAARTTTTASREADTKAGTDSSDQDEPQQAPLPERVLEPETEGSRLARAERTRKKTPKNTGELDSDGALPEPPTDIGAMPDTGVVDSTPLASGASDQNRRRAMASARRRVIRPEPDDKSKKENKKKAPASPENAMADNSSGQVHQLYSGTDTHDAARRLKDSVSRTNREIQKQPDLIEEEGTIIIHREN